jgi:heme-degrading monooxygenase HmoA
MEAEMNATEQLQHGSLYRIDKFAAPPEARAELLAQLHATQRFLGEQKGCRQNLVLEVQSGSDRFNVLTLVEWEDASTFEAAKLAIMAARRTSGFNPQAFLERLGVEADMANYLPVAAA